MVRPYHLREGNGVKNIEKYLIKNTILSLNSIKGLSLFKKIFVIMNFFFQFLQTLGINVNANSDPHLLFICSLFVLAILSMVSFINMLIYCVVLYITEHKLFLEKISKYKLLSKLVPYYRKTRISFLILELLIFLGCLSSIIVLCYKFIYITMS